MRQIIFWDDTHKKWHDEGNDFFCQALSDGTGWEVRARYQFEDGTSRKRFDTEDEAMSWYKAFLSERYQIEVA